MPRLAIDPARARVRGADLPYSDGIPLESDWHVSAMTLMIEILRHHYRDRHDICVAGNMFVYFDPDQVKTRNFRGPDLFVVKGVADNHFRKSWVIWEEEGLTPDLVIELASESTERFDRTEKKRIYQDELQVPDYLIYDPARKLLRGWRLLGGAYQPLTPNADKRIYSEQLGLWIGEAEHRFTGQREPLTVLRFFDRDGRMLPTPAEAAAARAAEEAARADAEAAARTALEVELAKLKARLGA